MKNTRLLTLFLILSVAVSLIVPSVALAVGPADLIKQADQEVVKAVQTKSDVQRDAHYKQAEKLYDRVIKDYKDTVDAAQAKFQRAKLDETAYDTFTNKKEKRAGKYKRDPAAIAAYGEIATKYDKPLSELKGTYTPEEAEQLKQLAQTAEQHRKSLVAEVNKENSSKWQYKIMDWLVNLTGARPSFSYWFALILLTVVVKILITPLTKAQFKSMKEMQKIQPLMKELQEKYRGDQKQLQEKMMNLYKEHGVNPFASCLPILIQMPILILVFQMISAYQYRFESGTFLWIGSALSHVSSVFVPLANKIVYFSARNLAEPDLILVVLYLISMFISQIMSITDPTQAEQQKMMAIMMPIMFGFLFAGFPSAFLFYWLLFNILQTTQQYFIIKSGKDESAGASGTGSVAVLPPSAPKTAEGKSGDDRIARKPSQGSRSRRRRR